MELHVVFESDQGGWVRATIEELARRGHLHADARSGGELVRDGLDEWLAALTTGERAEIGSQATRDTLTLSIA
jgi:hypothetical protein